jgi:hypothetical protein
MGSRGGAVVVVGRSSSVVSTSSMKGALVDTEETEEKDEVEEAEDVDDLRRWMEVGADEVVETDTPDATEEDRVELEAEDEGDAVEEERREKRRKLKSRSSNAKWPGSSVVRTGATTLERLEPARRMG